MSELLCVIVGGLLALSGGMVAEFISNYYNKKSRYIDLLKPIYEEAFLAINKIADTNDVNENFLNQFSNLRVKMELYAPRETFKIFEQVFLAYLALNFANNNLAPDTIRVEIEEQTSEIINTNPIILKDKMRSDLLIRK